jgi:LAO/AO transport system kinase
MKNKRKNIKNTTVSEFLEKLLLGDITYLSRAITLIESSKKEDYSKASRLLEACLPYANNSVRIGITGVPGVGKSTFIEAFGTHLIKLKKRIAVLTIDPSSSINKGSILGDKTRMEKLTKEKNAFIRPSPTGNQLGGVAKKTKEAIVLCEAAGYDVILVETVGVGQSETIVSSMVDFFLLLKLAGAGDELQGIKRGIMELTDAIIINKADNENIKEAELARAEFESALHLYPLKDNSWRPKVITCSALKNIGIDQAWHIISDFVKITKVNGSFDKNRTVQNKNWLIKTIDQQLKDDFYANAEVKKNLNRIMKRVENNTISPFEAANELIKIYFKKKEEN